MNYSWEEDPYNPRLNYGGYQPPEAPSYTPQQALKDASPLLAGSTLGPAGLALGAIGTGLNAYGAYEAGKDADQQYQLQKDAFEFDKAISLEDRERQEEERRRRAELEAGNYAGNYLDNAISRYGAYNAMTGR